MIRAANFSRELVSVFRAKWMLSSFVALAVAAAMVLTILSAGRGAALSSKVQGQLASVEARAIQVQAAPSDGIRATLLDSLRDVSGVEWAIGMGASVDVENAALVGGASAPRRTLWAADWRKTGLPAPTELTDGALAWADSKTLRSLGMASFPAVSRSNDGHRLAVAGEGRVAPSLAPFIRGVIVPASSEDDSEAVTSVIVLASEPEGVRPLLHMIRDELPAGSSTIRIRTSEELVDASAGVRAVLDDFGRATLLGSIVGAGLLIAALQAGMILLQRRDYGRRRALGATRTQIAAIVVGGVVLAASIGVLIGSTVGVTALLVQGAVVPSPQLIAAAGVLLVTVAATLGLLPAAIAAMMDPATEMRVP